MNKFWEYLRKPIKMIPVLGKRGYLNFVSDRLYLMLLYKSRMGEKLNLTNPVTFNEKLQWLKLYDRNSSYTNLADKFSVRSYVKEKIGDKYLTDLLGTWEHFEDIDFLKLPRQFVLKTTHDSGTVIVCKNKDALNVNKTKRILEKSLKKNYYWGNREWPYKNIKPKIICEEYIYNEEQTTLEDYKFMCFNGEPKIIQVMSNRTGDTYNVNHYNLKWEPIDIKRKNVKRNPKEISKPDKLNEMIAISKKLCGNFPFVRVDLYNTKDSIFFGELTFFPVSGLMQFEDQETNIFLGDLIKLDEHILSKNS